MSLPELTYSQGKAIEQIIKLCEENEIAIFQSTENLDNANGITKHKSFDLKKTSIEKTTKWVLIPARYRI